MEGSIDVQLEQLMAMAKDRPDIQSDLNKSLLGLLFDLRNRQRSPTAELGEIAFKELPAWKVLCQRFDDEPLYGQVLEIALQLSDQSGIDIGRETARRMDLLVSWLDQNLEEFLPLLNSVSFG
jgi:hypothetical protein